MAQPYETGPFIQSVTTPNNTVYYLKDAKARNDIENIKTAVTGAMYYVGITSTPITDGSTSGTVIVDDATHNFGSDDAGAVVIYGEQEFIWNGNKWQEFGSAGSLKALAFKDTASGSTSYTPAGTVSQPTLTMDQLTVPIKVTPRGNVIVTTANKTTTVSTATGTATYTPGGAVTTPTISLKTAGQTTTIKNPTAISVATAMVAAAPGDTAPSHSITYYSVLGENLSLYQLGYGMGPSITTSDVTVKTGDAAYQSSQPGFNGTGVRLVTGNIAVTTAASFSGEEYSGSYSTTPSGTVSQPTFTGTSATIDITVS